MKLVMMSLIVLGVFNNVQANSTSLNVSAQGMSNCAKAVKVFSDLVFGQGNPTVKIASMRVVRGECDGETCNVDSQVFKIQSKGSSKALVVYTVGPDRANRCSISF